MIGDAALARRLESFQADVAAELAKESLAVGEGKAVFGGVGSPSRRPSASTARSIASHRSSSSADRRSCDIAMITTLPGSDSHRNITRRGFELLYTKISKRLDIPAPRA